jgi:hypothetical protein
MAYDFLTTRSGHGLHPNFRGLGDLGAIGPTQVTIGPGGQWSVSTASNATPTSIWDQIQNWMGESTVLAGVPNSLIALGIGLGVFRAFRGGHRR